MLGLPVSLVAFPWIHSNTSMSFLWWGAAKWTWYSKPFYKIVKLYWYLITVVLSIVGWTRLCSITKSNKRSGFLQVKCFWWWMPLVYYLISGTIMSFGDLFRWKNKVFVVIVGVGDTPVPPAPGTSCLREHKRALWWHALSKEWLIF